MKGLRSEQSKQVPRKESERERERARGKRKSEKEDKETNMMIFQKDQERHIFEEEGKGMEILPSNRFL
jgi:hypothetical protein